MRRRSALWAVALLGLCAVLGAWHWRTVRAPQAAGVLIAGGDGGGLPRTAPELEGFDAAALQEAVVRALQQGTDALLIMRHGHLVEERYRADADGGTPVAGGAISDALMLVAAGIAVARHGMPMPAPPFDPGRLSSAIEVASGRGYPAFLSRYVWQPLHAGPAYWSSGVVRARCVDWLRVAELLLHDGRFEGTQIVQPGWIERHSVDLYGTGVESLGGTGLRKLNGPGATRLWLAPRLDVAILRVGGPPPAGVAVDETLARTIINTLRDRPATGGSTLKDLVPGH